MIQQQDFESCELCLKRVIEIDPNNTDVKNIKLKLRSEQKKYREKEIEMGKKLFSKNNNNKAIGNDATSVSNHKNIENLNNNTTIQIDKNNSNYLNAKDKKKINEKEQSENSIKEVNETQVNIEKLHKINNSNLNLILLLFTSILVLIISICIAVYLHFYT